MTNTHRKTTHRTAARIAAVSAFGIGAAIAAPGLAAAADTAPEGPTASLENLAGADSSLEGALDTDLKLDAGSLSFNLNLDAQTPNPGSIEFGSLGISPNTGSDLVDGNAGSGSSEDEGGTAEGDGSLDTGSLTSGSGDAETTTPATVADENATTPDAEGSGDLLGSLGSTDEATDDDAEPSTTAENSDTGSLSGSLAGLSSNADVDNGDDDGADNGAEDTGSAA